VNTPRISCIIAVYNGERHIARTLDNVLTQTLPLYEIIVVDDGSTDRTPEIVASYAPPVTRITQPNRGPGPARNRGILAARSPFLTFIDADDCWHPQKTERQWRFMEAHPEIQVSFTMIQNVDDADMERMERGPREDQDAIPGYATQTMLARREVFDRVGLFHSRLRHCNETEWILRARELNVPMTLLPDTLVYRALHGKNLSIREREQSYQEHLQLLKNSLERRRQLHRSPFDASQPAPPNRNGDSRGSPGYALP